MELVSIVIPCYNTGEIICECLNSILTQDYGRIEVLIIDDSIDDTTLLLQKIATSDSRIKLIHNTQRKGLSAARNQGLAISKGKYIWFVDSDDLICEGAISKMVQRIEANQSECVIFDYEEFGDGIKASEKKRRIRSRYKNIENESIRTGKDIFRGFAQNDSYEIMAQLFFWKKDFLINHKLYFYEGLLHEDNYFSFFALMQLEKVSIMEDIFYKYRISDNSLMGYPSQKRLQSLFVCIIDIYDYWKKNPDSNIDEAIRHYLDRLLCSFNKTKACFTDYYKLQFGNVADSFLYELFLNSRLVMANKYVSFSEEQLNELRLTDKDIFIYGAGRVAYEVITELIDYKIPIRNVVVTNSKINSEYYMGYRVIQIDELKDSNGLFVIAVIKDKWNEIANIIMERTNGCPFFYRPIND